MRVAHEGASAAFCTNLQFCTRVLYEIRGKVPEFGTKPDGVSCHNLLVPASLAITIIKVFRH